VSKFGTLVLIRQKMELKINFNRAVQVGRSVINFSVKECPPPNYVIGSHGLIIPPVG
jgi:hypothetical protein